ncbi:MAG: alpha/beta fold hydrolase [Arenimonas sp.]
MKNWKLKILPALQSMVFCSLGMLPLTAPAAAADEASAIPIEAFFKQDKLVNLKISPNGEYLAATIALADRTDLVFLSRNDSGVKLIARAGVTAKQHVSDFEWVNPSRVIFKIDKQAGKLSAPVPDTWTHAINADGTQHTRVEAADPIDTLPDSDSHVLVSDGRYVFYLNVYTGILQDAKIESPINSVRGKFVTDNSGMVRFFQTVRKKDISSTFYELDTVSREWTLLDSERETGQDIEVLGFSGDNKFAYLSIDQATGPSAVYKYDFVTKKREFLYKDDNVNPDRAYRSPLDNEVIALRFLDGKPRVHFLDEQNEFAKDLAKIEKQFSGKYYFPTSYTKSGNLAVIFAASDKSPGEFFIYDRKANTLAPVFQTGQELSRAKLSAMRPVKFSARDGLELEAFLTMPENAASQNLPMVLLVHGGPFGIFDTWGFNAEAQLLASRGYAVLQVNYRGSGNYGRSFELKGYQQWGRAMQDDLTDATKWAITEGIADKNRICIYGGSYGGYAALMGAVREPKLYTCSIGNVGVYDLNQVYKDDARDGWFLDKYFTYTLGNTNLESISPSMRAQEIKIPVLLGAGREDKTAPALHTERMRDAIIKAGGSVDTVIYEGEGHGNYLIKNQIDWASRVLDFLDKNIGPTSQKTK